MKWLKHMTATADDERIARLIGDGGQEGLARYGLYWRVNEIIAGQMEGKQPSCSVSYPISVWSRKLFTRGSLVFSTLSTLAVTGLVTVERVGSDIRVTNCNLLKYRDEYAKKSGHDHDNVPTGNTDKDTDTESTNEKSSTSLAQSVPPEELAGTLPLAGKGDYRVSKSQVKEWQSAYPGIDVRAELLKFKAWLNANPTRRKTARGICRAIVSWMSRAQDRGPAGGRNATGSSASKGDRTVANFQRLVDANRVPGNGRSDGDGDSQGGGGFGGVLGFDDTPTLEGEPLARAEGDRGGLPN